MQEYYSMTPYESYCRIYYVAEREREQIMAMGNIMRTATVILVNTQLKKEKQIKDPKKLWRFGWEDEGKAINNAPEVTPEQLKKISELL